MRKIDRYLPFFDGLPLLSGASFKASGLFFLRVTYLLFSAIPLLLSLLKAVVGTTQNILFFTGFAILAFPLLLDALLRLFASDADFASLAVLICTGVLIGLGASERAILILYFYHLCDLFPALAARSLRASLTPDTIHPEIRKNAGLAVGDTLRFFDGEVLSCDCRVTEGVAVCSTRILDPASGDFEAGKGDILFSGTRVESGLLVCEVLKVENSDLQTRVAQRVRSVLHSESAPQKRQKRVLFCVQLILIVFLVWYAAYPNRFFSAELIAYLSIPAMLSFALRLDRIRLLLSLEQLIGHGIYPSGMSVLARLPRLLDRMFLIDARRPLAPVRAKNGVRVFHPDRHPASRRLSVLEYAGEKSAWIARADLILLYRGREALDRFAPYLIKSDRLSRLLGLLLFVLLSALFLLLTLGITLSVILLILVVYELFALSVLWRLYHPFSRSYVGKGLRKGALTVKEVCMRLFCRKS